MPKLHIMKGLPASGKSTFAKKLVADSGNTVRINRDDLRSMCFESKWTRQREKFIISAEKALATAAFAAGLNVVIDDTNLANNIWQEFGRERGVEVVIYDLTGVPLQTCLERDWYRKNSVGPGVIYRMAAQAGLLPWTGRPIMICDLDGTICDLTHRLRFLEQTQKDYDSFFQDVDLDAPIMPVINEVTELAKTHDLVFVSGRPDTCAKATSTWIWLHTALKPVALLMRRGGDHRPDDQVKEELLALLPKERIAVVYDDRPRVIAMWRRHGLNVVAVNQESWVGRE